ncbi:TetR family transcriptional regulator [Mycobacterium florentinum]|uniref:TetR family transcriptional regulator n=1 Tax=Mycobacterium florentinum TaxID=292462 RepID=A0A1X1U6L5_MYCFL|nr:TetR/AcrR family transcriptional regulator [Mycobacterium florentinum]MCV7410114.1 TetR/AcrR family transcriptional regulator [Mycobacterium florentinum]ORV52269.1 TetR family transcriptional regulator [Mycobacterium florentinum]BBX79421.1 TetR family transcriptional regulator [Mycobacterium florentinum]
MRTRGWGGSVPASDEEAVARILSAARQTIDERGDQITLADVARTLNVTRQTIYHYFASTDELLQATALGATADFMDHLATALHGLTDPAAALIEGICLTLERLPKDPYIGLLLRTSRTAAFAEQVTVTNETARVLGRSILERLDVDWSPFTPAAVDDILQIVLRTLQSFIMSPPAGGVAELRRLLAVWVGPVVAALPRA